MSRRPVLVRATHGHAADATVDLHVFCERQGRSMPLASCRACPSCEGVEEGGARDLGYVICGPDHPPDSAGELVDPEAYCVGDDVSASALRAFFVERGVPRVLVVTAEGRLVGVVDEHDLVAASLGAGLGGEVTDLTSSLRATSARDVARSEVTVLGSASVREALVLMAETHRRHAVVVDVDGVPLGVLTDVVALRALKSKR